MYIQVLIHVCCMLALGSFCMLWEAAGIKVKGKNLTDSHSFCKIQKYIK